ncbi:hypothetical protein, partial [Schleiferilactobacillus harbinensis]|uniref:hypothetical protein n=2 Tax=Schleiferilactobacillus harbinensis TaxID=304207 RepID=UPI00242BE5AB
MYEAPALIAGAFFRLQGVATIVFIFFELIVVQCLLEIDGNTPPDIRFDGCYKQTIENKKLRSFIFTETIHHILVKRVLTKRDWADKILFVVVMSDSDESASGRGWQRLIKKLDV